MELLSIHEISEMFRIPASTLRYYEEMGILKNVQRDKTGKRVYSNEHMDRIGAILCFKRTGMTINQLKTFFGYEENEPEHIDEMLALLNKQKLQVAQQMLALRNDYEHILRKLCFYGDIKEALEIGAVLPNWKDYETKDCSGVDF